MTTQPEARAVIVGVDTHKHVHVAVVIDTRGIRRGGQSFVADAGGYRALLTWADTHGRIEAFGIEGTGRYGAGLARAVRHAGHRVAEVNRSDRRLRRAAGKWRCCMNRHWPARCPPTESSPADAIRRWSADGGHPIQDLTAEDDLTSLPGWPQGPEAISDDGRVAEERVLHPALTMVP